MAAKKVITILLTILIILSRQPLILLAEEYYLPPGLEDLCDELAPEYGICPELIEAIIWHESRGKEDVISKNGRYFGLMQIDVKHPIFKDYELLDPISNIRAGCELINAFAEQYEDIGIVMDLYSGYGLKYAKMDDCSPTTKEILAMAAELEERHGKIGGK